MAYTMVQGIGKLSLKMGVLLRGSVYEQKKVRPISQCIHNTGHLSSLTAYDKMVWKKKDKSIYCFFFAEHLNKSS